MKKEKKSRKLDARVTELQYETIEDIAHKHNSNVSEFTRELLFTESNKLIDLQKSYLVNLIRLSGLRSDSKKELLKEITRYDISNT